MDEHEMSRLLDSAAAEPSRPVDHEAIAHGVRGRRRRRRSAVGVSLALCLAGVATAAFALVDQDDTTDVQVVDPPATTTSTTEPTEDGVVVATRLDDVELWQLQGRFLVHGTEGISWLVDGHREQVWDEPVQRAYSDGRGGAVFQDRPEDGAMWFQQRGAIRWLPAGQDSPIALVPDGQFAELFGIVELDGEPNALLVRWLQWPDLDRPIEPGSDGAQMLFARSLDTDRERQLGIVGGYDTPMRWAAMGPEGLLIQACHLTCAIHGDLSGDGPPLDPVVVDWDRERNFQVTGLATAGDTIATIRFEEGDGLQPERPVLALLEQTGTVSWSTSLPDLDRSSSAGGIELDLASDATAALIRPRWSADRSPSLVRGVGTDSPTVQRVRTDQTLRFAPDAPTPGEGPPPIDVEATEVGLADLDGRFLMFGSDGIAWLENGVLEHVWDQPVEQALPDGMGGVVFQGVGTGEWPDAVTGAIRWLAAGSAVPEELVAAGDRTTLHQVVPLDGEPTMLVARWTGERNLDDGREHLVAVPLAGGPEAVLAETGSWGITGLDGVALTDVGLVTSTCHLQCTLVRVEHGSDDSVVQWADWSSGLAGTADVLAFVAYLSPFQAGGYPADPVLRLIDARNEPSELERFGPPLVEVRLPHRLEGGWSSVDLARDARLAIVVTARPDEGFDVVLVTGLDTGDPLVQIVQADQALRFG